MGPLLPPAQQRPRGGRPRQGDRRAVLQPLLSRNRRGGPWDRLPHDWLPQSPVDDDVVQGRDDGTWAGGVQAWRARHRVDAGRAPTPRAACRESPAVQTTAMGGPARGSDGGKNMNGRPRPLVGETLGLVMTSVMTRAGLDAGVAARQGLGPVHPPDVPRLVTILADQQSHQHALDAGMAAQRGGWRIVVNTRPAGTTGVTPLEKRGVIERTHAWPGRDRSNSQDDERSVASRTAMIQMSPIQLMRNRLAPCGRPEFHDRKKAA